MFVCILGMYCYYVLLNGIVYWYIGIYNENRLFNENDIKVRNKGEIE